MDKTDPQKSRKPGVILVVEDAPPTRIAMEIMLRNLGITTKSASNGQEALELVTDFEFILILMDIQMPVMNGIEATESIRSLERMNDRTPAPIVAITSSTMLHREKCASVGMNDFFEKPMLTEELEAIISKWAPDLLGASKTSSEPD